MHPLVRIAGKILRLVGISSPEDSIPKSVVSSDSPAPLSWRNQKPPQPKSQDSPK
jgi:hypothetical protein